MEIPKKTRMEKQVIKSLLKVITSLKIQIFQLENQIKKIKKLKEQEK